MILVFCIVCGVFQYWHKHHQGLKDRKAVATAKAHKSQNGFIQLPRPDAPDDQVVIFAAVTCSRPVAQHANALARQLESVGVPCHRTQSARFSASDMSGPPAPLVEVMEGALPVVFINGWAKNNPTFSEIISEYHLRVRRQ